MFHSNIVRGLVTGLLCLCAVASLAQEADLLLTGTLSRDDHQSYREIQFTVPAGTERITVEFSYDRSERTTVDLGLYDSQRFRGWSGGNKARFTLSETDATPSYLPGPLPAGEWRLLLGIPNIRDGVTSEYAARIYFQRGAAAHNQGFTEQPLANAPGWYRGELHAHSGHSDGRCTRNRHDDSRHPCPLEESLRAAEARGLDFISLTEHNARSQYGVLRELQPHYEKLLLLPGREITTFYGHANLFGTTGFVDFRVTDGDIRPLQQAVQQLGGVLSINHPGLPSGEDCMGCGWTAQTDYRHITAMEVINGSTLNKAQGKVDHPYSGIPYWEKLLQRGYRITAIAGSDNHNPTAATEYGHGDIGAPATVIYARELSQAALMAGLKSGRVFIDLQPEHKRTFEMQASAERGTAAMGETLEVASGETVEITLNARGVDQPQFRLVTVFGREDIAGVQSGGQWHGTFRLPVTANLKWARAEIRDVDGNLQVLGNPVFFTAR
ncbi:CehA/McbA family metallohydrolase [Microbulbifer aggregans]|uniref:CehA/McbA family metallohydrolase n=1 Tax=Microbulbifer aggregans TaxID=1769779 RepID=UPI001CFE7E54|nr:CehA/McbA family metallohydrolase [Microbulbifer aggregans]